MTIEQIMKNRNGWLQVESVEQCGEHYKSEGWYRIPVRMNLEDGSHVVTHVSGKRLKEAKELLANYQRVGGCVGHYVERGEHTTTIVKHYIHSEWLEWHKQRLADHVE